MALAGFPGNAMQGVAFAPAPEAVKFIAVIRRVALLHWLLTIALRQGWRMGGRCRPHHTARTGLKPGPGPKKAQRMSGFQTQPAGFVPAARLWGQCDSKPGAGVCGNVARRAGAGG